MFAQMLVSLFMPSLCNHLDGSLFRVIKSIPEVDPGYTDTVPEDYRLRSEDFDLVGDITEVSSHIEEA